MTPFGSRLSRIRHHARMTQEELARKAGVPQQSISAYERGFRTSPTLQNLQSLASALNVSPLDLDPELGAVIPADLHPLVSSWPALSGREQKIILAVIRQVLRT